MTLSNVMWMENCFCVLIYSYLQLSMHPYLYSRRKIPHSKHKAVMLSHALVHVTEAVPSLTAGSLTHPPAHLIPAPLQQEINPEPLYG